jgi:acetyl esterase/lipase
MLEKLKRLFGSDSAPETAGHPQANAEADDRLLALWKTEELEGRRVDVFIPEGEPAPAGVVLFLHGHGRILLNENQVFTRLLQQHHLAAVCPDGGRSWWLNVVCEEFHPERTAQQWLLESVVPLIEQRFGISPPRIALLGISMGGQGVLQLAFRHATQFPVVSAIAPAVDFFQLYGSGIPLDTMFPNTEAARQATVVLNLNPLFWPRYQFFCCDPGDVEWFDGAARLGMKLSSSGILHERDLETTGGGHSWDYFNKMAPVTMQHIATSLGKLE